MPPKVPPGLRTRLEPARVGLSDSRAAVSAVSALSPRENSGGGVSAVKISESSAVRCSRSNEHIEHHSQRTRVYSLSAREHAYLPLLELAFFNVCPLVLLLI